MACNCKDTKKLTCTDVADCPAITDHKDRIIALENTACVIIPGTGITVDCTNEGAKISLTGGDSLDCLAVRRCLRTSAPLGGEDDVTFLDVPPDKIAIKIKPSFVNTDGVCDTIRRCVAKPRNDSGNDDIYHDGNSIKIKAIPAEDSPWIYAKWEGAPLKIADDHTAWTQAQHLTMVGGKDVTVQAGVVTFAKPGWYQVSFTGKFNRTPSPVEQDPNKPKTHNNGGGGVRLVTTQRALVGEVWAPITSAITDQKIGRAASTTIAVNVTAAKNTLTLEYSSYKGQNATGDSSSELLGSSIMAHWLSNNPPKAPEEPDGEPAPEPAPVTDTTPEGGQ